MKAATNFQAIQPTTNETVKPMLSGQPKNQKAANQPPLNKLKIISKHYGFADEIVNPQSL